MCYDVKVSLEAQLKRAERKGDLQAVDEILERLVPFTDLPLFHASGFGHPNILIYTDRSPDFPEVATWGLVPHWVKDEEQMKKTWNNTLNARGETIFKKPSFKTSALHHRCIIYVDGFYEHHHFNKSTYPYYIHRKDGKPIALAGLYSEWENNSGGKQNTFSIVTTTGNKLMTALHNNPKLEGPRMPVILPDELEDQWFMEIDNEQDRKPIEELIKEYPMGVLDAYTVRKLRGKEYLGNTKEISEPYNYVELPELSY